MNKFKHYLPDFFAIIILIFSGVLVLWDFRDRVDINLTDDTGYLTLGLWIQQGVLAGFGPLYSLFFKLLKQIFDDPVDLYDAVVIILSIAPAVCAYIFLRALKIKAHWALLMSGLFLFSSVNMSFITWSRISHYSISIIFLWAAIAARMRDNFHVVFSLVLLGFFLGYVRPEYHLSWYLAGVFLLLWWIAIRRFELYKREVFVMVPLALFMLAFFYFIGNPMAGNRTFTAFAQQFSYNYCEWNGLDNYDWIQWMDIAKDNFGEFTTLGGAYANNPETFSKHILYNIQQYFLKGFRGVQDIFFPPAIITVASWLAWLLIALLLGLRIFYVGVKSWGKQVFDFLMEYWIIGVGLLLLSGPSFIASMVFYTREHYLVLQMPLVFFLFALVLYPKAAQAEKQPRFLTNAALPIVAIFLLSIRPDLSDYRTFDVWQEYTYPSNRKVIETVRGLGITDQPVNQLDHEGGFFIYIGKNYKWVNPFNKNDIGFKQYIDSTHINMVYVTKALLSNRHFGKDEAFMELIDNPQSYGFYRMDLEPENKGYLLLSDTLRVKP